MQKAIFVVLLLLFSTRAIKACSCTVPNGSSASATKCHGGCYAICGSARCSSGCATRGGPLPEGGEAEPTVSLAAPKTSAGELARSLREQLGERLVFVPSDPSEQLSVELSNMTATDLRRALAKYGATAERGGTAPGPGVSPDSRVSLQAKDVPVETLGALLRELTGENLTFRPKAPGDRVSLEIQNVTIGELLQLVSRLGEINGAARRN